MNSRTLAIASIASATAATVTSQLWIAGTWIAAAVTPVLVTLVSEALNRPTERIARAWSTSDRPALRASSVGRASTAEPRVPPSPEVRRSEASAFGEAPPVRFYRQPSARAPRKRLALSAVAVTAGLAFLIGAVTLTAGELVAGGSVAGGDRKTTFGGGTTQKSDKDTSKRDEQEQRPSEKPAPTPRAAPTEPPTTAPEPTTTEPAQRDEPPTTTAPPADTQTTP